MLGNETTNKLAIKFALPVTIIIAVVAVAVGMLTAQTLLSRLKAEADKERQLKAAALAGNLETTKQVMLDRVREAMRVYQNSINQYKKLSLAPSVQLPDGQTVPNLMADTTSLVGNDKFVYDLAERTGANIGVYVRTADNRFVAVATTTVKADKSLAIGDALETGGREANDLLAGKVSYGVGRLQNRAVVRGLEPIKDAGGRIIGAWSAAYPVTTFGDLSRQVANEKILNDGFLAVYDDKSVPVAKSKTAPDAALDEMLKINGKEISLNGWNVSKTVVPDWNYTILAGYSNSDSQISSELSSISTWTIMAALLVTVLLGGIVILISMRITGRLEETVEVAEKLAEGDLSADLKVTSSDEVGRLQVSMVKMLEYLRETAAQADQIAAGDLSVKVQPRSSRDRFGIALRNMLDNVLRLVQSQEERDQLQNSIMKLLEEVADVAEGDLTGQAEVTADATGAIADAFNYMIDELRGVVRRVKDAATQVGVSTGDIRATTEKLAEGSAYQAEQIALTSKKSRLRFKKFPIPLGNLRKWRRARLSPRKTELAPCRTTSLP
jgi:HAMP domain-containing protein